MVLGDMARHSSFNEVQATEVGRPVWLSCVVCRRCVAVGTSHDASQVGNLPLLAIKCASRTSPAGLWTGGDGPDAVDEAISVFRANVFYRFENEFCR